MIAPYCVLGAYTGPTLECSCAVCVCKQGMYSVVSYTEAVPVSRNTEGWILHRPGWASRGCHKLKLAEVATTVDFLPRLTGARGVESYH